MGQSQLLIIAVSVLIVGVAILAGTGFFVSGEVEANKKAMINDINHIAMNAVRYYRRIPALGGGGNSYNGYAVPAMYQSDLNGRYSATASSSKVLLISGISARDTNCTMAAEFDAFGKGTKWTFTGDFQ